MLRAMSLPASMFSPREKILCERKLQAQFRSPSISATSSWVPSGRSKYFDICFPRFCILSTFRMRDQSFWCSKDIYGGQSKSALRRLQQACFLPQKMFDAEGSCRLSFSQPVHFGYILLGAFWSFSFSTIFFFNIFATSNWIDCIFD